MHPLLQSPHEIRGGPAAGPPETLLIADEGSDPLPHLLGAEVREIAAMCVEISLHGVT
jgi:hypothetical protein